MNGEPYNETRAFKSPTTELPSSSLLGWTILPSKFSWVTSSLTCQYSACGCIIDTCLCVPVLAGVKMELWVLKCAKVLTCEGIGATPMYNICYACIGWLT